MVSVELYNGKKIQHRLKMSLIQKNDRHNPQFKTFTAVIKSNFPRIIHPELHVDIFIGEKTNYVCHAKPSSPKARVSIRHKCPVLLASLSPGECDLTPRKIIRVTMVTISICRLFLPS